MDGASTAWDMCRGERAHQQNDERVSSFLSFYLPVIILILCTYIYFVVVLFFCRGLINRPSKSIQGSHSCWVGAQQCWERQSLLFFFFLSAFIFHGVGSSKLTAIKMEKPPRDSDICLHASGMWGKGNSTNFQSHGVFTFRT